MLHTNLKDLVTKEEMKETRAVPAKEVTKRKLARPVVI
jgi:hypothetical protein